MNATFIVTIPKKGKVEDFKGFRLRSLIVSLYKLLANVLENRLKHVIPKLINIEPKMLLWEVDRFWMCP